MKPPHRRTQIKLLKVSVGKKKKKGTKGALGLGLTPVPTSSLALSMAFWVLKAKASGSPYRTVLEFAGLVWDEGDGGGKEDKLIPTQMDNSGLAEVGGRLTLHPHVVVGIGWLDSTTMTMNSPFPPLKGVLVPVPKVWKEALRAPRGHLPYNPRQLDIYIL